VVTIVTTSFPNVIVSVPYSQTVQVTGSVGTVTYSIQSGALPSGLNIGTANGVISGTTTVISSYSYNVRVDDTGSPTAFQVYTGTVEPKNDVVIDTLTLPNAIVSIPYDDTISVEGIYGTALFSITAGSLPSGLMIEPDTGRIFGTPSAAGTFNFTLKVDDNFPGGYIAGTASRPFVIVASVLPTPGINPLPEFNLGFRLINAQFERSETQQYSIDDPEGRKTASAGNTGQSLTPRSEFRLSNLRGHGRVKKTYTTTAYNVDAYVETLNDPRERYAVGKSYITMIVNSGVRIGSTSTSGPAFVARAATPAVPGFVQGDLVEVANFGTISGRGGNGGAGRPREGAGSPGSPGTPGIRAAYPIQVVNNPGAVIAGGGGGGCGGSGDTTPIIGSYAGGGGGGGAGTDIGIGGSGYRPGQPGTATLGGAGGAGQSAAFAGGATPGGRGGNLGQAGTPVGNPGGAAGRSISGIGNVILVNSGTLIGPTN
jgi:hypothetical protein